PPFRQRRLPPESRPGADMPPGPGKWELRLPPPTPVSRTPPRFLPASLIHCNPNEKTGRGVGPKGGAIMPLQVLAGESARKFQRNGGSMGHSSGVGGDSGGSRFSDPLRDTLATSRTGSG